MDFKGIMFKIGKVIKGIFKKIGYALSWTYFRIYDWILRTRNKISRIYLIYACIMSGILGFFSSIKAQYKIWKTLRKEYFGEESS
jgi:hypothetical protein